MVDHLTRVTVQDGPRSNGIVRALSELGFTAHEEGDRTFAESSTVEACEVKRHLRELGFEDRQYQVFVEFVRKWGVM